MNPEPTTIVIETYDRTELRTFPDNGRRGCGEVAVKNGVALIPADDSPETQCSDSTREMEVIRTILEENPVGGYRINLASMDSPPDAAFGGFPDTDQFITANRYRNIARAEIAIAWLSPREDDIGAWIASAHRGNLPVILLDRVPKPGGNASVKPGYIENINQSSDPCVKDLPLSVRGTSLTMSPSLVRYWDRYELEQHFRELWAGLGRNLVDHAYRARGNYRAAWGCVPSKLLERRRILGLSRQEVAALANCSPAHVAFLETSPLLFPMQTSFEQNGILDVLGLAVQEVRPTAHKASAETPATLHKLKPATMKIEREIKTIPVPFNNDATYKMLAVSYRALEELAHPECEHLEAGFAASRFETIWNAERARRHLPRLVFANDEWVTVNGSSSQTLWDASVNIASVIRNEEGMMPQTVEAWRDIVRKTSESA